MEPGQFHKLWALHNLTKQDAMDILIPSDPEIDNCQTDLQVSVFINNIPDDAFIFHCVGYMIKTKQNPKLL